MTISETAEAPAPEFSPLLREYTLDDFWALPDPENLRPIRIREETLRPFGPISR